MRAPDLAIENYEAVYDYYANRTPNMPLARFAHFVMDRYYDPTYQFVGNSEETLGNHLADGGNLIIPATHASIHDQFILADMANHNKALHALRGTNTIPAKVVLFENKVLRLFLDRLGAIPTYRSMDIADNTELSMGQAEILMTWQKLAGQKLVKGCIQKFDNGESVAIFPENTRNKGDTTVLQPLKQGVGKIACGVSSDEPVFIMPVSIYYGEDSHSNRKAYVAIDCVPLVPHDPVEVTALVAKSMQAGLDLAVEMSANPY